MPLSQATRDKIKDLEYLLTGHRNRIRVVRTTLTDDAFYQRSLEAHTLAVVQADRALDRLVSARNNGPAIIAEAQADCKRVLSEIKTLKSSKKLDKIAQLRESMAALESEKE